MSKEIPSMDVWLREAKESETAARCGMFLTHNGVVRETAKAKVRDGRNVPNVKGLILSCDWDKAERARLAALEMPGIYYARAWVNEGELRVGDDMMYVLIGGDIRPHVIDALQCFVGELKNNCVTEKEIF